MDTIGLTIDGKEVQVSTGARVLDAIRKAGIYIPTLCYDDDLEPYGGCRLCIVEIEKMRGSNAEWDFMGRTFFVLTMANMALRDPAAKSKYLARMDEIIEATSRVERKEGLYFFLMDYARDRPFVELPARSLFIDGEIALMLGARRLVAEKGGSISPSRLIRNENIYCPKTALFTQYFLSESTTGIDNTGIVLRQLPRRFDRSWPR